MSLSNCLKNLLESIIFYSKEIEQTRIYLYKNPSFNYQTLCHRIDRSNLNIITLPDLLNFLNSNTYKVPKSLLQVFILHFSKNENLNIDFLTYDEFKEILYPKSYISSRIETKESGIININFDFEQIVCKIIIKELKLINIISFNLDKFYDIENFTVYDIINYLNEGSLFFTENEIENFCLKNNIEISHNELKTILFYFQADKEKKIYYNQLKKIFKLFILSSEAYDFYNNNNIILNRITKYKNINDGDLHPQNHIKKNEKIIEKFSNININEFFISVMQYENILYNLRNKIYNNNEIVPIELFYVFDVDNKNFVTKNNFKDVMYVNFNINCTNEEINIIFNNYSKMNFNDVNNLNNNENNYDEKILVYDDFKRLLIPFSFLNDEKLIEIDKEKISDKSKSEIIELFKAIMFIESKIEKLKIKYTNSNNFNCYEDFLKLKGQMRSAQKIDKKMLYNYLLQNNNGYTIDSIPFEALFNRIDWDEDLMISYEDFARFVSPVTNN